MSASLTIWLMGVMAVFLTASTTLRSYVDSGKLPVLIVALFLYTLGNLMMVRLMRESGMAVAVSLSAVLQLVLASAVGLTIFGERPSMLQLAGIALGIVAVTLIVWPQRGAGMSAVADMARPRGPGALSAVTGAVVPVLTVVLAIVAIWYAASVMMNRAWTLDQIQRQGLEMTTLEIVAAAMTQERPVLPTPHQVFAEIWNTTVGEPIMRERRGQMQGNPRNLIFHAYHTLWPTILGFGIGSFLGILLAVGIVHSRAMDMSVMPWAIASQTIPILAIAPIIVVVVSNLPALNNAVDQGWISDDTKLLVPKALISSYLSFFPVVVGMVAGLRSPQATDLDLMRTYSASRGQTFWKLRLPASVPFLFTSLKVSIAAALVGTIVAELPTGARFGLGARLLTGSYYGQTIQIWSALFMAAICAAALVILLGVLERVVLKRMGARA